MLRDHSRNHPCEDVSRAASSHARIARRIDPSLTPRLHHQRAMPFEHHDQFVLTRELSRHSQSIFLHISNGASRQTRHLTRMRRDHNRPPLAIQFLRAAVKSVQAVRIHHHRDLKSRNQTPHQFRSLRIQRNPRPDRDHILAFRQLLDSLPRAGRNRPRTRLGQGLGHQLRMKSGHSPKHGPRCRDCREPGPRAQRGHPGHRDRSSFPERSAEHHHVPVAAFVRLHRARPDQWPNITRRDHIQLQRRNNRRLRRTDLSHEDRSRRQ